MGVAIVSLLVLVIVGALGGLVLSRVFARAAARNEDAPGDNKDEQMEQQAGLSESDNRAARFFFGASAAMLAILIDVAIVGLLVASVFFNYTVAEVSGLPTIFLVLLLGLAGYFLGARKLAIGAIAFTAVVIVLTVIVTMTQGGG